MVSRLNSRRTNINFTGRLLYIKNSIPLIIYTWSRCISVDIRSTWCKCIINTTTVHCYLHSFTYFVIQFVGLAIWKLRLHHSHQDTPRVRPHQNIIGSWSIQPTAKIPVCIVFIKRPFSVMFGKDIVSMLPMSLLNGTLSERLGDFDWWHRGRRKYWFCWSFQADSCLVELLRLWVSFILDSRYGKQHSLERTNNNAQHPNKSKNTTPSCMRVHEHPRSW